MCMFSLGDFLYLFFFFADGRGVWVATKWDIFLGGGGGGGMFDTYILRKGCGAK